MFHDAYHIDAVVGNDILSDPDTSLSPLPTHLETNFRWMYRVRTSFVRQRYVRPIVEIQLRHHHDKTHALSLNHEPLWLPSNVPRWDVFLDYPIS